MKNIEKISDYVIPTLIEISLLVFIAISTNYLIVNNPYFIACLLLFSMGLQNSFVNKISKAVVRTTHLTGLFTDLGIELSQLFFPKIHPNRAKIKSEIKLHFFIIAFFFLGGITGGLLFCNF